MVTRSLTRRIRSAVARFTRTRFFRRRGPGMMPPLERAFHRLGARGPLSGVLVPSLVLHSQGARSGLARHTPLMYCPEPSGTMLITGSNFAREKHPAWTWNLLANPEAEVTVDGVRMPVRATAIAPAELDETWAFIEEQWPGYRGYEASSGRTLRIFRLEPAPVASGPSGE